MIDLLQFPPANQCTFYGCISVPSLVEISPVESHGKCVFLVMYSNSIALPIQVSANSLRIKNFNYDSAQAAQRRHSYIWFTIFFFHIMFVKPPV